VGALQPNTSSLLLLLRGDCSSPAVASGVVGEHVLVQGLAGLHVQVLHLEGRLLAVLVELVEELVALLSQNLRIFVDVGVL